MSRYISYDILNIFCNNLIRAIFLPQKFLPHNRMCLHKINSYNLHTNGSQICASDLAIVCRSLGLQASFNVGSFSDQILLSIKEITQQKFPAPLPQMVIPTDLCRPSIEAKHKKSFPPQNVLATLIISRGRESPLNYKQRSPAL